MAAQVLKRSLTTAVLDLPLGACAQGTLLRKALSRVPGGGGGRLVAVVHEEGAGSGAATPPVAVLRSAVQGFYSACTHVTTDKDVVLMLPEYGASAAAGESHAVHTARRIQQAVPDLQLFLTADEARSRDLIASLNAERAAASQADVDVVVLRDEDGSVLSERTVLGETTAVGDTSAALATFEHSVLGGTFDRLHNGHKVLLTVASVHTSGTLWIGVTVGPMVANKKFKELIQSFDERKARLVDFFHLIHPELRVEIEPIEDPFGPSTRVENLQAIIVSPETVRGGDKVNQVRAEKGLSQLEVLVIEFVGNNEAELGADEQQKLSSSALRERDAAAAAQS